MKISRYEKITDSHNLDFLETPIRSEDYNNEDITMEVNNILSSKSQYSNCEIYMEEGETDLEKFYEDRQNRMEQMLEQKRSDSVKKNKTLKNKSNTNNITPIMKRSQSFVEEGSITHRSNVKSYREFKDESNFKIKITRNKVEDVSNKQSSNKAKSNYNPTSFRKENKKESLSVNASQRSNNTTKNADKIALFRDIIICNNENNIIVEEKPKIKKEESLQHLSKFIFYYRLYIKYSQ